MKTISNAPKGLNTWLQSLKSPFLVVLLALVIALSIGCQPKLSAKETFDRIQQASMEGKAFGFNIDGKMSMNMGDALSGSTAQDPAISTISNMMKDTTFKMEGYFEKSDKIGQLELKYDIDLNGMAMHMEFYFDDEKFVIKYPMMPQLLVMDVDQSIELLSEKAQLDLSYDSLVADYKTIMTEWYPEFLKTYLSLVSDKDVELIDKYVFTVEGKEVTSKAMRLKFSPELVMQNNKALLDSFMNSQKIYDIVKKYDADGAFATFEDYQESLKEISEQVNLNVDDPATKAVYENMKMDYVFGYDKNYHMTYMDMTMDMTAEDPAFGKMNMIMDMTGALTYAEKDIAFPELTETNQMNLLEMLAPVLDAMQNSAEAASPSTDQEGISEDLMMHLQDVNYMVTAISRNSEPVAVEAVLNAYYKKHEGEIARIYFAKADKSIVIFPPTEFPADYDPTQTTVYETAVQFGGYSPEPYVDFDTNRMIQHIARSIEVNGEIIGVLVLDYFVGD